MAFSTKLIEEVITARNMRKQYILAVVDDEEELTYYEINCQNCRCLRTAIYDCTL